MPGAPLSLPEREEIGATLIVDRTASWAEIGRRIGRHRATVAREVGAGGGRWLYRPAMSQRRAEQARRRPRHRRLACRGPLRDRVTVEPGQGRSPEAIWADLVADDAPEVVCTEAIYRAVYAGVLEVKATECLRMRRPRRRCRQSTSPVVAPFRRTSRTGPRA